MKTYKLKDFTKGWFIGNFSPSLVKTEAFEVGIKVYKKGDKEASHFHKIADEYTIIIDGVFEINGKTYAKGDMIHFEPNDISHFSCKEDGSTVVVKMPSVTGDKYIVNDHE